MRRRLAPCALVAAIAVTSSVRAEPLMWGEPDPAAVVGRWKATIKWRGCAATGAARASLDVARDGSGYALDLAPVLDGLGATVLVPAAAKKLETSRDDLRVEWTTGKHNRATLIVKFSSGCTGTAALVRDGTGGPACDELAALEAIAGRCEIVQAPEISADDRKVMAGVRVARTRSAATTTCTRYAKAFRASLVEVGCVPTPIVADGPVRIPECEALVASVARLARCNKVPADSKQRLLEGMQRVARAGTLLPPDHADENLERMKEMCIQSREDLESIMQVMGC